MFAMRKNSIFYEIERENKVPELAIGELKNESNWADTAAKMLLKLVEKGILNFNKREEGK